MSADVVQTMITWWRAAQRHADRHLADPDPEHIHQFRTHMRRLRSLLSRLEPALPAPLGTDARRLLRALAKRTDALRDLDVLLACREPWMGQLAPDLRAGGREVWSELRRDHRRARRLTDEYLRGRRFGRQCAEITARLASLADVDPDALERRTLREIGRRYGRLAKAHGRLTAASPAGKWHRLRIRAKVLRYSLEALPQRPGRAELLRELKRLQLQLGDFNDLAVQKDLLADLATRDWSPLGLQAIGAWRCRLHQAEQEVLPGLPEALDAFCAPATEQLLDALGVPTR